MLLTLTLKNRLYCSQATGWQLDKLSQQYARACSYASNVYFKYGCSLSETALHALVYRDIRCMFGLKAQEADSVPRTVEARYKSVNTQLYKHYPSYRDVYTGKYFHLSKNVRDLWNPIHFRTPQADLVYKNDWSIKPKQHRLSVNTLNKRVKVQYHLPNYFKRYLEYPYKLGTAKLLKKGNHHYLYVSCTITIPKMDSIKRIIGNDRGLRFMYYSYDGNHSKSMSGLTIRRKRCHFLKHRRILQSRCTKSAKRKLKYNHRRENCWMTHINHCASKTLVNSYPKGSLFTLENLRGVRFSTENVPKRSRYTQVSWPFYQFGQMLAYKAALNQSKEIHVNPQYTSQRCPKCGYVMADSRNHKKHVYKCLHCGYQSNDDRIGGMNIRFLGKLDCLGYHKPYIKYDGQIGYHKKVHERSKKTGRKLKKMTDTIRYLSRKQALNVKSRNQP